MANEERDGRRAMRDRLRVREHVQGPLLVVLAIVVLEGYRMSALWDPDLGPALLAVGLLAAVVVAAVRSGLRPGLIGAVLGALYSTYAFSVPGRWFRYATGEDARRTLIIAAVLMGLAALIGYLKDRIDRLLARERAARDDAERGRASAEAAQARLDEIVRRITDGLFALDRNERLVYSNPKLELLAGRPRDDLLGHDIREVLPDVEESPLYQAARRALRDQELVEVEGHYAAADRWLAVRAYPSVDGVSVFYSDVTARRRAEREVRQRERQLRQLTDNISEVLWLSDPDMDRLLFVSPAFEQVWGRSREEVYRHPRSWLDAVHEEDRARVEAALADVERGCEVEYRIVRPDGEVRWVWSRAQTVQDEKDGGRRLVGVTEDITRRKLAEREREELLARERSLRRELTTTLERIRDGFIAVDREWRVRYVNPEANERLTELLGRAPGDVHGRSLWEVAPTLVGTGFEEACRRGMAAQSLVRAEEYVEPSQTWFDISVYPSPDGVTIYFRDMTERKRVESERARLFRETQQARQEAEQARDSAREAAQRFAFLAEASTTLSASLDYGETLRRVAQLAVTRMADFCLIDLRDEETGEVRRVAAAHRDRSVEARLNVADGIPPRASGPLDEVMRSGRSLLVEEVTEQFMLALARSLGDLDILRTLAPRALMMVPLLSRGRTLGVITFAVLDRDYTADDLGHAEELARRAAIAVDNARLYRAALVASQAKSDFLAVMSHELRTPLNAVLGYADLLLLGVPEPLPDTARSQVERILASTRHLLELIEEILSFSRLEAGREAVHAEDVDIGELVRDVASMTEPLAKEKALRFAVHAPAKGTLFRTDSRKVRQILINLLSNAVKFTDEGEVTLAAAVEDDRLRLRVSDTGIGIPPEHRERIFDPFWQIEQGATRRASGTGLGLSVTRRLARLLGGDVSLESERGRGSTFTVELPPIASPRTATRSGRRQRQHVGG